MIAGGCKELQLYGSIDISDVSSCQRHKNFQLRAVLQVLLHSILGVLPGKEGTNASGTQQMEGGSPSHNQGMIAAALLLSGSS